MVADLVYSWFWYSVAEHYGAGSTAFTLTLSIEEGGVPGWAVLRVFCLYELQPVGALRVGVVETVGA